MRHHFTTLDYGMELKNMRIAIVDDEQGARETVKALLETYFPNLAGIEEADSLQSATDLLQKGPPPDLLILDIDLQDGTGFDLLESIPHQVPTIFVTAYNEYALDAFRFCALDYLLKPLVPLQFAKAVQRAVNMQEQAHFGRQVQTLLSNLQQSPQQRKIVLRTAEAIHILEVKEITRCQADGNYTCIHTIDERAITVSQLLKHYERLLTPHKFLRIHQSHLINLDHLKAFHKRHDTALLTDGSKLPVATRKREALLAAINSL